MADVELLIKIPEELYKEQLNSNWTGNIIIHDAIVRGIPLPKGHGRLIDADAIQKYQIDTFGKRLLVIDTAPTIIEADKTECEDKNLFMVESEEKYESI